jgi:hypothetical protein
MHVASESGCLKTTTWDTTGTGLNPSNKDARGCGRIHLAEREGFADILPAADWRLLRSIANPFDNEQSADCSLDADRPKVIGGPAA